tara:strand:- start:243 stop:743 length:501 start_codon:yes stop_codon:yes gene_type:complete
MKQGAKANLSGAKLEHRVQEVITSTLGIEAKYHSRTKRRENILLKSVPYTNIYGNSKCRSEFVICKNGRKIRVECKAQHSAGSVDEKLPYLYLNFTSSIEENEAVVVVDGDGFKEGAKEWLKDKCENTKVLVFNPEEFEAWMNNDMPVKMLKPAGFGAYIRRWFSL